MIRTIVTPTNTDVHISIPLEYVGKTIEISYLPIDELENKPVRELKMIDFWNTISDATATKLQENVKQMRNEWERDI